MNLTKLNSVLRRAAGRLSEEAMYTVDGKEGVWRTVRGHRIFFPKDGGDPIGMPGAMKTSTGRKIMRSKRKGPRAKVTDGTSGSGTSSSGTAKTLSSKDEREKVLAPKKNEMESAASGAAEKVVDAASSGGQRDAMGRFIKGSSKGGSSGGDQAEKDSREVGSGAAKKAMAMGLGAALLTMFPALLGHAVVALVAKSAAKAIGKHVRRMFEGKTSRKEQLKKAIEMGLHDAIDQVVSGSISEKDVKKAMAYAEKKVRGEGDDA